MLHSVQLLLVGKVFGVATELVLHRTLAVRVPSVYKLMHNVIFFVGHLHRVYNKIQIHLNCVVL